MRAASKTPKKQAADVLVFEAGLAETIEAARALIMTGHVIAEGDRGQMRRVEKPGDRLDPRSSFRLAHQQAHTGRFVSRGGLKLEHALRAFDLDVTAKTAIDVGIGSGGFTDCLLQREAAWVYGVDVGYGQVAWRIRNDPRVVLLERTNLRHLDAAMLLSAAEASAARSGRPPAGAPTFAVIDVSFISLTTVVAAITVQLPSITEMVALIKPQFECPREALEGGVVTGPEPRRAAIDRVHGTADDQGWARHGLVESPILGRDGNVEYLTWLHRAAPDGEAVP
ncbi:MAG: TlyA family RNA methyltransferase [Deltaproteobacteria bacterium]|nr:TlyA family RNA methyltransferase [Deltaproteobacteria bacterium]